mgnify:CR=1 FL=1
MNPDRQSASKPRGQWQVQRERARIEDPYPPPPFTEARSIGQILPEVMRRIGLEDQHWISILREEWPQLVGAAVAQHTRPARFEGKTLIVFVDSAVWLHELARYGRQKMLMNVQRRVGPQAVSALVLRPDPEGPTQSSGGPSGRAERRP